jgi:hypothetical protein
VRRGKLSQEPERTTEGLGIPLGGGGGIPPTKERGRTVRKAGGGAIPPDRG